MVASGKVSFRICRLREIVTVQARVACLPAESLAFRVKLNAPVAVGAPLNRPVAPAKVMPGGSWPVLIDHV